MSVRQRLTAWYAALTAITLIVSSLILYLVLQQSLNLDSDAFLTTKASEIGAGTQIVGGPATFWVRLPDQDRFVESDVYVQVLNRDGEILDESPNLGSYGTPMDPLAVSAGATGHIS